MAILVNRNTKLITVGFTGKQATFHSLESRDYGTNFVGGVVPGKGGVIHEGFPVFNTAYEAVVKTDANAAMIFTEPLSAADSILECIEMNIPLIVCITEGIPVLDMIRVKAALKTSRSCLVGPNCSGVITPGESKVGIMPGHIHMPGKIGVISRSGTMTFEAVNQLTQQEIGQSTCVDLGNDPVSGADYIYVLKMFENDSDTDAVVIIGEIEGMAETDAAMWIRDNMTKPVIGYMAGILAPEGRVMGHTPFVNLEEDDTVELKLKVLEECGVYLVKSPAEIGSRVGEIMRENK